MADSHASPTPRRLSGLSNKLAEAGLRPDRRFSQSFLVNPRALGKIVEESGVGPQSSVAEIGAGLGNLTEALAQQAGSVTAVELDRNFEPLHKSHLGDLANVRFVYGDILEMRLADLRPPGEWTDHVIVGNIPYHITSRILIQLAAEPEAFDRACILMQWEVAERLRAQPGTRLYSVLTAKLRCGLAERVLFRISGRSFQPPARVDSALVEFVPLAAPLIASGDEQSAFFAMLDAAFSQRRKTLANALAAGSSAAWPREAVAEALESLGFSPTIRAEQLPVRDLLDIHRALTARLGAPRWRLDRHN